MDACMAVWGKKLEGCAPELRESTCRTRAEPKLPCRSGLSIWFARKSDWDPKDFLTTKVEGPLIAADDVELDEALDVTQQDMQKKRDTMEHPRSGPTVMNNDVVIEHTRARRNPKAPWCPVSQMAEAPPFKHQSRKSLSIHIAGPLIQDMTKSKYIP
eukprot:1221490-Amphidinium_carterae.2